MTVAVRESWRPCRRGERPSPIGSRSENAVEYESFSIQPLPILYIETVLKARSTLSEMTRKVVFLA
jgi:hypothetical protein